MDFIREYADDHAAYRSWNKEAGKILSLQLSCAFDFYMATILNHELLLLLPKERYGLKQLLTWSSLTEQKTGYSCVLVLEPMSAYQMKVMLQKRVGFIVPGKQLFLPSEILYTKKIVHEKEISGFQHFMWGTQQVFVYMLCEGRNIFTMDEITNTLHISDMTVSRGLNELEAAGIVTFRMEGKTGRKKVWTRESQKQFWKAGKPYLRSPVMEQMHVTKIPENVPYVMAGLSALAGQTILEEPECPVYAVSHLYRNALRPYGVSADQGEMENLPLVQLLRYDPVPLSKNGYIDPVTLILSLDETDERIEKAVEELMRDASWYMG